jgi:hypothetical protein
MAGTMTGEQIDQLQRDVVPDLIDWACQDGTANVRGEHYLSVVEGRNHKGYSSCADLAHWLLFRLGCRQTWLNRQEHAGWQDQVNVSRFAFTAPNSVRRTPASDQWYSPGDVLIVWNLPSGTDAHVMVVRNEVRLPGKLVVGEFGQPGGHVKEKLVTEREGYLYVHGKMSVKRIQRWLPLHLAVTDAAERELLAPLSLPWEKRDGEGPEGPTV